MVPGKMTSLYFSGYLGPNEGSKIGIFVVFGKPPVVIGVFKHGAQLKMVPKCSQDRGVYRKTIGDPVAYVFKAQNSLSVADSGFLGLST